MNRHERRALKAQQRSKSHVICVGCNNPGHAHAITEETSPSGWWFLSFADTNHLGACVVEATTKTGAFSEAEHRNLNPGGQVLILPVPLEELPEEKWRNRLLTEVDLKTIWPEAKSLREWETS